MSAIIAGKECKKCGQEYYVSLGHPSWFKKRWEDLDEEGRNHREMFGEMQRSGRCLKCQLVHSLETAAFISQLLGIDLDLGEDDAS